MTFNQETRGFDVWLPDRRRRADRGRIHASTLTGGCCMRNSQIAREHIVCFRMRCTSVWRS